MSYQKVFENAYLCSFIYSFLPKVINIKNGNNDQVYFFGKKMYIQGMMVKELNDLFCLDSVRYVSKYVPPTFAEKHEKAMRRFLNGMRLYPSGWLVLNPSLISWFCQASYAMPTFVRLLLDNDIKYYREGR